VKTEKPPEQWLYKAWGRDVLIDIIFAPRGGPIDDAIFSVRTRWELQPCA
jgi:hypothetical protein